MSILIGSKTRVIVQGISGNQGRFHTELMKKYGTRIVAGVVPGRAGQRICRVPVYDHVSEALIRHKADWSIIFVPAPYARDAALEALYNGLHIIVITENMHVHDVLAIEKVAKRNNLMFIGPNCPGIISVGECKMGIMPDHIFRRGNVGVVSRSGTLTYEVVHALSSARLGQSTCVGIGGDSIIGETFVDILKMFEEDPSTKRVVMIGEIGGSLEEEAAEYVRDHMKTPVVAYIAGRSAPKGKQMGHAGAIISGRHGGADFKRKFLEECGVRVADLPSDVVKLLKK